MRENLPQMGSGSVIDCHAHVHDIGDLELLRAKDANVLAIINVATSLSELAASLSLAEHVAFPKIYTAAATTPHDAAKFDLNFFDEIKREILNKKIIAIGETGLDYHYTLSPVSDQRRSFEQHIELAIVSGLPLVIHCRDAFCDLYSIFDQYKNLPKVMLHCFTGTKEEAKQAVERGFIISFSGIVTFKKSVELQEVARYLPLDAFVLETDAPYLAPQTYRGKKNEPAFIVETAKCVAALKDMAVEELVESTTRNAKQLFCI